MPNIEIPDLFSTKVTESKFCVDPKQYSQSNSEQKKLLETYKLLNISGAIDHSGCIVESAKSGAQGDLIKNFIKENLENMPVKILMGVEENTNSIRLNMAIQSEKKFNSTVLSTKDRWQIAIGGLTTGTTYLLLETAGLGDKSESRWRQHQYTPVGFRDKNTKKKASKNEGFFSIFIGHYFCTED